MQGMLLHQDASIHEWVAGQQWDLIMTMENAINKRYAMSFVDEEGTQGSFQGVREVVLAKLLFCALYTDRGSRYWYTPEAGGKVDKSNLTQFGQAMKRLGIEMIPAYSPEARGRSERAFATHQARLPNEFRREVHRVLTPMRSSAPSILAGSQSTRPSANAKCNQWPMHKPVGQHRNGLEHNPDTARSR